MHKVGLAGRTFGRLKVIAPSQPIGIGRKARTMWLCLCRCGHRVAVAAPSLTRGLTESCGCSRTETTIRRSMTHGDARRGKQTTEYRAWIGMKKRCYYEAAKNYSEYGGRGISVCERWRNSFENFLADMGRKPSPRRSLDRIDNDGNYEPGNCRWATASQQMKNKRVTPKMLAHMRRIQKMTHGNPKKRTPEEAARLRHLGKIGAAIRWASKHI